MEYKDIYEIALNELSSKYRFPSDNEIINVIKERKEKMRTEHSKLNDNSCAYEKRTNFYSGRIVNVICGIMGTSLIIFCCILGINILNKYGGLKEGGVASVNSGNTNNDVDDSVRNYIESVMSANPAESSEALQSPEITGISENNASGFAESSAVDKMSTITMVSDGYISTIESEEDIVPSTEDVTQNSRYMMPAAVATGGFYGQSAEIITGNDALSLMSELSGIDEDTLNNNTLDDIYFDGTGFYIDYSKQNISPFMPGKIEYAGYYGGFGKTLLLLDDRGYYWFYYHLGECYVETGDRVEKSTIIAETGSSGAADKIKWAMRVGKNN